MITKGNNTKVQNEVIAQTITDETAKRLKLARLFPKQEIKENSDYYTYFRQNINLFAVSSVIVWAITSFWTLVSFPFVIIHYHLYVSPVVPMSYGLNTSMYL